jgi:hypothetical protein
MASMRDKPAPEVLHANLEDLQRSRPPGVAVGRISRDQVVGCLQKPPGSPGWPWDHSARRLVDQRETADRRAIGPLVE